MFYPSGRRRVYSSSNRCLSKSFPVQALKSQNEHPKISRGSCFALRRKGFHNRNAVKIASFVEDSIATVVGSTDYPFSSELEKIFLITPYSGRKEVQSGDGSDQSTSFTTHLGMAHKTESFKCGNQLKEGNARLSRIDVACRFGPEHSVCFLNTIGNTNLLTGITLHETGHAHTLISGLENSAVCSISTLLSQTTDSLFGVSDYGSPDSVSTASPNTVIIREENCELVSRMAKTEDLAYSFSPGSQVSLQFSPDSTGLNLSCTTNDDSRSNGFSIDGISKATKGFSQEEQLDLMVDILNLLGEEPLPNKSECTLPRNEGFTKPFRFFSGRSLLMKSNGENELKTDDSRSDIEAADLDATYTPGFTSGLKGLLKSKHIYKSLAALGY